MIKVLLFLLLSVAGYAQETPTLLPGWSRLPECEFSDKTYKVKNEGTGVAGKEIERYEPKEVPCLYHQACQWTGMTWRGVGWCFKLEIDKDKKDVHTDICKDKPADGEKIRNCDLEFNQLDSADKELDCLQRRRIEYERRCMPTHDPISTTELDRCIDNLAKMDVYSGTGRDACKPPKKVKKYIPNGTCDLEKGKCKTCYTDPSGKKQCETWIRIYEEPDPESKNYLILPDKGAEQNDILSGNWVSDDNNCNDCCNKWQHNYWVGGWKK